MITTYCEGGFPNWIRFTEDITTEFRGMQHNYIDKYMCTTAYCPCIRVDSSDWGDRENELSDKNFNGTYSNFN
jgi:hypothetical protein